jgi:hypothetical protein
MLTGLPTGVGPELIPPLVSLARHIKNPLWNFRHGGDRAEAVNVANESLGVFAEDDFLGLFFERSHYFESIGLSARAGPRKPRVSDRRATPQGIPLRVGISEWAPSELQDAFIIGAFAQHIRPGADVLPDMELVPIRWVGIRKAGWDPQCRRVIGNFKSHFDLLPHHVRERIVAYEKELETPSGRRVLIQLATNVIQINRVFGPFRLGDFL